MIPNKLASAAQIRRDVAELIRPPRRVQVSQAAAERMYVVDGAGRSTLWSPDTTPYMRKPMDCLASRRYDAVVFVGPARSGKTLALVDGWVCYVVSCDPGDMLIIQISEEKAREYSKKRLDRMLRHSPDLASRLSPRGHDNNVHDRTFRAGNYLGIKWPSKNVMASSDFRFAALTDYDRLPLDIDGEGDPFTLTRKRTQTFGSSGMTLAESSPGFEVIDPDWRRPDDAPHMMPPAPGIASLYNQGDRQRLYWQCDGCRQWYQPVFETWHQESARPFCPHCGSQPEPQDKRRLNLNAEWVPEGCRLTEEGELVGTPRPTRIASFWMEGPAAAYQTWQSLAEKLRAAEELYENTGSQETLKSVINTDWGRPYIRRVGKNSRSSERLMDRAEQTEKRTVPDGVRFLTAAIDVQGGKERRFVVQVHGWGVGRECWVVDRFNIKEDLSVEPPRRINPGANPEDWDVLTRDVLSRCYPLDDGSGRFMQIAMVAADSGGEEGVTFQAYAWYRRLRQLGLHKRLMLIKGASTKTSTPLRETYPDSTGRKDRKAGSRGDVPVWQLGTDVLKDAVAAMLDREEPGANYLHVPSWLGRWWYEELTYEVRGADGKWRKPGKGNNESFDLGAYNLAAFLRLGGERINWDAPPAWAREWNANPLVQASEDTPPEPVRTTRRRRTRLQIKR